MTSAEIIEEIKRLPAKEKASVLEFAREEFESRRLTPEELMDVAQRMVDAEDPAEGDRLQEELIRGFYGRKPNAKGQAR